MSVAWSSEPGKRFRPTPLKDLFAGNSLEQQEMAIQAYLDRYERVDMAEMLALRDEADERIRRAAGPMPGDDDPATFADWWDCTRSLYRGSPWAQVLFVVVLPLLLGFATWGAVEFAGYVAGLWGAG